MPTFEIEHQPSDGDARAWQVTLRGELDVASCAKFDATIDAILSQDVSIVVLELSDVTFLDSSGLSGIVRASNVLSDRNGHLTVGGLSTAAERILELTGLLGQLRRTRSHSGDDGSVDDHPIG